MITLIELGLRELEKTNQIIKGIYIYIYIYKKNPSFRIILSLTLTLDKILLRN